jgi:hypothetical protein
VAVRGLTQQVVWTCWQIVTTFLSGRYKACTALNVPRLFNTFLTTQLMKNYEINRSKDELGNNVAFEWVEITHKEKGVLANMAAKEDFRQLVDHHYGFTFMSKGDLCVDVIDYCIMISSEEDIPQGLVDKVLDYIDNQIYH